MSQPLRRGVRAVSWTRVLPPRARQGPSLYRAGQTRCLQIRAAAAEQPSSANGNSLPVVGTPNSAESAGTVQEVLVRRFDPRTAADSLTHADARFDVIGAPYSLLSVSLSASQNLFTRRGTLVGLSGKADNVPGLKGLPSFIQDSKFIRDMSGSDTWKTAMNIFHKIRTWSRMTIWGDRLFLQFDGPSTILLQTRGPRINEVLTSHEVNEIASAPRGLTIGPAKPAEEKKSSADEEAVNAAPAPTRTIEQLEQEVRGSAQSIATLTKEGKVIFEKPGQQN
ncbi:hypothetical protein APSETT444_004105 [Aspergillus pseudonomiae]